MKLLEKTVVLPHGPDRAPLCGFVSYIHPTRPVLLRRLGWEVSDDIHDDFADAVSEDNGVTWGEPRRALSSEPVEGGHIVHTENAVLYLPDRHQLVHWTNDKLENSLAGGHTPHASARVRITAGTPEAVSRGTAEEVFVSDFGLRQGLYVSFCNPIRDSRGRLLVPAQWQREDPDGSLQALGFKPRADLPGVMADYWQVGLIIGDPQPGGGWRWRLGQPVPHDPLVSSRGMCEPTVAELPGGRLAAILRGSNAHWPDRPGYKWLSFSDDGGETWSQAEPLPATGGPPIESSATGSALFRTPDGRLRWIGNLCPEGVRPRGNDPRSPLYLAEIREEPFAIRRETLAEIDRAQPGEHPRTQHSNFKYYVDRLTGELVIYLTRYGQRGYDQNRWILADLYRYRLALD